MITDPVFYALAVPAVILSGLAKGGFAGVGAMSLPLMALAISPVQAAAVLLPILIVQDAVGAWAFRKTFDRRILMIMVPGAAIGIVLGYLLAAKVSTAGVLAVLGAITVFFAGQRLWLSRGGRVEAAKDSPAAVGVMFGVIAGFTSQIAHVGAPPFQMWVAPKRLAPLIMIGTSSLFFFIINWLKVPAYIALGQFTTENLMTAAVLLPVAVGSTFAGVWLVRRIEAERLYRLIYFLMLVVGVQLLWKAFAG